MAIPNPNPNIADGIKCDNKTYSSNKIESLISTATELPIPAAGDAGKVLTVNAGATGYELDPITHPDPVIYTETERKVGSWIDGSDLYQITLIIENLSIPKNDTAVVDLSTLITDLDTIVYYEGFRVTSNIKYNLDYCVPIADAYSTICNLVNNELQITRGNSSDITADITLTVRYTKTA